MLKHLVRSLLIGSIRWPLKRVKMPGDEEYINWGHCHKDRLFFEIDDGDAHQHNIERSALHESIHAISFLLGLTDDDRLSEEDICTRFEQPLWEFVRNNPEFVLTVLLNGPCGGDVLRILNRLLALPGAPQQAAEPYAPEPPPPDDPDEGESGDGEEKGAAGEPEIVRAA